MFGLSSIGLRLFSVIAQAVAIVLAGLMAAEFGGRRLAQIAATLAVALSALPLFEGTEFQYSSFDYLWWVLIAYFTIRLLKSEDPHWWLAIGAVVGLGLQTKYSIAFYIAGILAGVVLTRARRYSASSPWFWAGIALALLIFLPNFLWLVRHHFISYQFLQHIHARDVGEGRAEGYLRYQLYLCINPFAVPLAAARLHGYFRNAPFRMLAWMFVIPFVLFWIGKGRFYYIAAAYPMLLGMGAVEGERWLARRPRWARLTVEAVFFTGPAVAGGYSAAVILPLASSGPLRAFALKHNGDLREEIGWNQLVKTVVQIRDSLPLDQQAHLGITTGNYGEYGAIEILGRPYRLPEPIGTTNSEWLRGYPTPPPTTFIVLGLAREQADTIFSGCRLAGHNGNREEVQNEESRYHPDIFVCGVPREPWPVLWKSHQDFG